LALFSLDVCSRNGGFFRPCVAEKGHQIGAFVFQQVMAEPTTNAVDYIALYCAREIGLNLSGTLKG